MVLNLDVRQSGLTTGAPVDHPLAAVDLPLLVKADEDFSDGSRETGIEGESLPPPIRGGPQGAHLLLDVAAVLILPLPDPFNERLTAKIVPGQPLFRQRAFNDVLSCDPGVIHPREPADDVAVHPFVSDDDVVQRVLKRVSDVHCRSDVRRWDYHREALGVLFADLGVKEVSLFPEMIQLPLHLGGLIAFGKLHSSPCSRSTAFSS